jgi:hypothetical protein
MAAGLQPQITTKAKYAGTQIGFARRSKEQKSKRAKEKSPLSSFALNSLSETFHSSAG